MPFSFDQSKDKVAKLVRRFHTNRAIYIAPAYKEAHARLEFINPFFMALNWDVQNRQHAAPDYREVIAEDSPDTGYHVVRFINVEVHRQLEAVLEAIRQACVAQGSDLKAKR